MHRHRVGSDGLASEIVLVTQDLAQLSAFVRSLVEQTFKACKLTAIGSNKRYRIDIYEGAVTGPQPPASKRLREIFGSYRPEIFALYRSHTQSQSKGVGTEAKPDQRGNVLHGWRLKIAVIALLALPLTIWATVHSMQRLAGHSAPPAAERSEAAAAAPTPRPEPAEQKESTTWRYAGEIVIDGMPRIILDSDHGPRLLPPELCKRDAGRNVVCTLGNEVVTSWTGKAPQVLRDVVTAAVAPSTL